MNRASVRLWLVASLVSLAMLIGMGHAFIGSSYAAPGDLYGPAGSGTFGLHTVVLPNGNLVVTDPGYDAHGLNNIGAVYVYAGATRTLISTLTGSSASDQIGIGGVVVLANGNYVVQSPFWNGTRGAVTWGSSTSGVAGVVSSSNSLTGSSPTDYVGRTLLPLTNGNYVTYSTRWNSNRGAVTWGSGNSGVMGVVSSSNSLVGSIVDDQVGYTAMRLSNGNYVVGSPFWNGKRGAIVWGDGTSGITGEISSSNALVGSMADDQVGGTVMALANGNYIVVSHTWNGTRGAVTWGSGTSGVVGQVNSTNSLVGGSATDYIGANVVLLPNGSYIVQSREWNGNRGAATWANGASGVVGVVSSSNSLVGSIPGDQVGRSVVVLANTNYFVLSPFWNGNRGAATWANGASGVVGVVSSSNSLVGSSPNDQVGHWVTELTNGNYVVTSPQWNAARGAATWASGTSGMTGEINSSNSLVGSFANDQVGMLISPLANGNYVVGSSRWNSYRGAATWGSGSSGVIGEVSSSNSLIGSMVDDLVGETIVPLTNGNYVVGSSRWNAARGAATWGSGSSGVTGAVSSSNSLVGSTVNDEVGYAVTALENGNYVVGSPFWNGNRGAATWGSGSSGVTGAVSSSNSLVGSMPADSVGYFVTTLATGNYVVHSPGWNAFRGAVTWGSSTSGVAGVVSSSNSLTGSSAYDLIGTSIMLLANGNYLVASPEWNGSRGAVTWGNGNTGVMGVVSSSNSLVGSSANDSVADSVIVLADDSYLVLSPQWNDNYGAVAWGSSTVGRTGVVSSSTSIVGEMSLANLGQYSPVFDPVTGTVYVSSPSENRVAIMNVPRMTSVAPSAGTYGTPYSHSFTSANVIMPSYTVIGELPPGLSLNAATGLLSGTPRAAGSFVFTIELRDSNGRVLHTPVTLLIQKATLTVTARNTTMVAGASLPVLELDYTGLLPGDSVATALSTPPNASTTATTSSPPGTYAIIVQGGDAANYTLTRVDGTLTIIAPAAQQVRQFIPLLLGNPTH